MPDPPARLSSTMLGSVWSRVSEAPHLCPSPPAPCSLTGGCTGTLRFLLVLLGANEIHVAVINRAGALWEALFKWPQGSVSTWEMCAPYIDRLGSTGCSATPGVVGRSLPPRLGQTGRQVCFCTAWHLAGRWWGETVG